MYRYVYKTYKSISTYVCRYIKNKQIQCKAQCEKYNINKLPKPHRGGK